MSKARHHERLLADVLAQERDLGQPADLLNLTLRLVRRRRRVRKVRQAAGSLVLLVGLLLLVWRFALPPAKIPFAARKAYTLVRTRPLPGNAFVETKPFPLTDIIHSSSNAEVIGTSTARRDFRELNDDQLLDLAGPASVVLVRHGPHNAELVFADPGEGEARLQN
jgi:hypothetical protein